jgi:superfamily I DNA/RNA helicase
MKIVRELDNAFGIDGQEYVAKFYAGDICKLVAKAKAHGLVPHEKMNGELADEFTLQEIKDHYNLYSECPDDVLVDFVVAALKETVRQTNIIDYDDQLYFVVAFDLPVPQYSWIIVDEAQDLSHINRAMLRKFLATNGNLIAVGDDAQAIYGFRGADSTSLDTIIADFNADQLPLDTTYRCPKAVVEIAQKYVPEINCPDTAPEGTVEHHDKFELGAFNDDDLIVCRNTAPLITSAYRMIRHGHPVRVMGRDIGKGLTSLIKKIARKQFKYMSMGEFEKKLGQWMRKQVDIAKRRDQEDRIEAIQDKAESLFAIIAGSNVDTLPEVCHIIDDLFQGDRGPKFATVHKAKGLEANRVFILDADLMPSKFAKQPWQMQQEKNLIYVAVTRALDTLCYIRSERLM